MVQYFAMIDGERCGPYRIEELSDAGVRPETYVWCKGMADWDMARNRADICRFFRGRILDLKHPSLAQNKTENSENENNGDASDDIFQSSEPMMMNIPEPDYSIKPPSLILPAMLVAFFCFPFTGFIAMYNAIKSQRMWNEKKPRECYDYRRKAKMWIGITISIAVIFYGISLTKIFQ